MVVLGIDPGYALMGYGAIETDGRRMKLLGYGVVETHAGTPMQYRLRSLQLGMRDLIELYHPDLAVLTDKKAADKLQKQYHETPLLLLYYPSC